MVGADFCLRAGTGASPYNDMSNRTNEWSAGIHALMWAAYNLDDAEVLGWVYDLDKTEPTFIGHKAKLWRHSPLAFVAELDQDNTRRFVEALRLKYEADLIRRYDL